MNQLSPQSIDASLERIFGFASFRPGQREIVEAVCSKQDVLAIMPTGGGKSLCYQLPACLLRGTCIVVSPLIALMKDQVDAACANGIKAASLTSSQTEPERRTVLAALTSGELNVLYVSPERFGFDHFMDTLQGVTVSFVAIDEAHCICSWGHDFRPDYLLLADVIRKLPDVPVAAFTASATGVMQRDIIRLLGLRSPFHYCGSFNRANLFYEVLPKVDVDAQILAFVNKNRGESGIIYRTTRDSVEQTADMLAAAGINALPYHAGLSDDTRRHNQEQFSRDRVDVVVATIAFGMGIDKSNVRFVVHGDLPRSLEHYYQETGRGGRDGDPAHCLLLFSRGDIPRLNYFIDQVEDADIARRHRIALAEMVALASRHACRRKALLLHFGEELADVNCGGCDICSGTFEVKEITTPAQMLLSAIARTGERFGMMHIVNIVRGAKTAQIRNAGHDTLKTYGSGSAIPKRTLLDVFDALIEQDMCVVTEGQYPVVKLSHNALGVLMGTKKVTMQCKHEAVEERPAALLHEFSPLFEQLRTLRKALAEEQGVPPFVIFSDRTLHDMVQKLPCDDRELLLVNGVGNTKLERYGEAFLGIMRAYLEEHPEAKKTSAGELQKETAPLRTSPKREERSSTLAETESLIRRGLSVKQIAEERNLTEDTIAGHIERLYTAGRALPVEQFIDDEKRDAIAALFTKYASHNLKPVVEALNGRCGYSEARIVRAWMMYGAKSPVTFNG